MDKGTKRQWDQKIDKNTKGQLNKRKTGQWDKETKGQKGEWNKVTKGQRDKGRDTKK